MSKIRFASDQIEKANPLYGHVEAGNAGVALVAREFGVKMAKKQNSEKTANF